MLSMRAMCMMAPYVVKLDARTVIALKPSAVIVRAVIVPAEI